MRPKTFDEVIGLEDAIRTIKAKLDKDEIPRAWLIKGPYGCGKTSLGLIIARYVQGPLFEGTPNIHEVNGANYRKIDDMRVLAAQAGNYPPMGTYTVIIMDECQQLTKDAQQVLLKELEVPKSPTVWILCTTDPDKINPGVRDRCFPLEVRGMSEVERHELVKRAATEVGYTGSTAEFETAITKASLISPRKILMAFDAFKSGIPARQAVSSMHLECAPELFDIAAGVVFGNWEKKYVIPWMVTKDAPDGRAFDSVGAQIKKLDDRLKKKAKEDKESEALTSTEEQVAEATVEDDDLTSAGKDECAHTLSIIVASLLKNKVLKGGAAALKAAQSMVVIAQCSMPAAYGLEWPLTIGGLYRVHLTLKA
jgi:hypothetical protein